MVSGIGCSSRVTGYVDFQTIHSLHGRAIAFATGVKMARPDQRVIVLTGDGDAAAIGGNHLIHGARRNIDITVILMNNSIYGMTGGQVSPTTPAGALATTAPYGQIDPAFDIARLAIAAGASYVARTTAFHARKMEQLIADGMKNPGFSLVEVMATCPVGYGKLNKMGSPADMLRWLQEHSIESRKAERSEPEELEGKFVTGMLHHEPRPEYSAVYQEMVKKAGGEVRYPVAVST
jgi:2-oxoglutarate ferredoxin oxidoreductase subunit beta